MQFEVKHPSRKRRMATCGKDGALGIFGTVFDGEKVVAEYDGTVETYDGVPGLLLFLAVHGFFTGSDATLALQWIQHSLADAAEDNGVRKAAQVAERLY